LALLLLIVTAAAYAPAWHGGPVWDDEAHLTRADLQTADGVRRIWTEPGATQQYYPVTHTAFWIQNALWGHDTFGYHLVNILLHAGSAFLLALILWRLGVPGAALAAFLFALHPVHVESVAWISELKNTLSGTAFFAAALAYLTFDDTRSRRAYAAAVVLFVIALLSKSVTATLPMSLLVVLWWRRGRLELRRDVWPLVPLVGLGAGAALLTVVFERAAIGAQGADFQFSLLERGLIAGRVAWFYVASLAWPLDLSFNYPRWIIDQRVWWQYLFPIAWVAALVALWRIRHWSRAPLAGVLWFLITVAPAMGFVNVYPFKFSFVADHFQYLASAGLIALAAAAVVRGGAMFPKRIPEVGLIVACVLPLGWLTWNQSAHYADAATLYRATLASNPDSWLAHNNLAALLLQGSPDDLREAARHSTESIRLREDNPAAHYNAATALSGLDEHAAALDHYRVALRQFGPAPAPNARLANVHLGLGRALAATGRGGEAIDHLRQALEYGPGSVPIHTELGIALARSNRPMEAVPHFEAAIAIEPASADHHNNLGGAWLQLGRFADAERQFAEAVRLDARLGDAHVNRGIALEQLGRDEDATRAYLSAIEAGVRSAAVHNRAGMLLMAQGQREAAIAQFQRALTVDPTHTAARANLTRAMGGR
jgi:tetratricopeptide (TPR) repeat protein